MGRLQDALVSPRALTQCVLQYVFKTLNICKQFTAQPNFSQHGTFILNLYTREHHNINSAVNISATAHR